MSILRRTADVSQVLVRTVAVTILEGILATAAYAPALWMFSSADRRNVALFGFSLDLPIVSYSVVPYWGFALFLFALPGVFTALALAFNVFPLRNTPHAQKVRILRWQLCFLHFVLGYVAHNLIDVFRHVRSFSDIIPGLVCGLTMGLAMFFSARFLVPKTSPA